MSLQTLGNTGLKYSDAGDPTAPRNSGEVIEKTSESELAIEAGTKAVGDVADEIYARLSKRVQAEGRWMWHSPFERPAASDTPKFETEKECDDYTLTKYPAQVDLAMQQNNDAAYRAKKVFVAPKLRKEDYVSSRQAGFMQQQANIDTVNAETRVIVERVSPKELKATTLMGMSEALAIPRLGELSDAELLNTATRATNMGRSQLAKAAKKLARQKGLELPLGV